MILEMTCLTTDMALIWSWQCHGLSHPAFSSFSLSAQPLPVIQ